MTAPSEVEAPSPEETAKRLRQAIREAGISRRSLSKVAAVDPSQINRMSRGILRPGVDVALRLSAALGVSAAWLLGIDEPSNGELSGDLKNAVRMHERILEDAGPVTLAAVYRIGMLAVRSPDSGDDIVAVADLLVRAWGHPRAGSTSPRQRRAGRRARARK